MVDEVELGCCFGMISLSLMKAIGYRAINDPFTLTLRAAFGVG